MNNWDMGSLTRMRGKEIYSADGEKIGAVKDIFYDETSRLPEWVGVGTGFLGLKERVIPVDTLKHEGERLTVNLTKDRIVHEPDFDTKDDCILSDDEAKLASYFGMSGHTTHVTKALREGEDYLP
jgi:sporulation protein YlmC with PRC-barrel domain